MMLIRMSISYWTGTNLDRFRFIVLLPLFALLTSCKAVVMDPSGDIAAQQRDLILVSTWLMLLIIVPVMVLTIWFAWRYRHANNKASYDPDWDHSTQLELVIWAVPLLIIICLGAVTWVGTHLLDPYRALSRLAPGQAISPDADVLDVDVVALDWKWLFFYPQYGIATVNELAAPVDRPIRFHITASTVMNSFYIPALAGQIYAMPGMETRLEAVINNIGDYRGFSANYSGAGFSGMHFVFHGQTKADFTKWVKAVKAPGEVLNRASYLALAQPTSDEPIHHYGSVDGTLYKSILNMCVEPGSTCMSEIDRAEKKRPTLSMPEMSGMPMPDHSNP